MNRNTVDSSRARMTLGTIRVLAFESLFAVLAAKNEPSFGGRMRIPACGVGTFNAKLAQGG